MIKGDVKIKDNKYLRMEGVQFFFYLLQTEVIFSVRTSLQTK
jgi:hypothetical protein